MPKSRLQRGGEYLWYRLVPPVEFILPLKLSTKFARLNSCIVTVPEEQLIILTYVLVTKSLNEMLMNAHLMTSS